MWLSEPVLKGCVNKKNKQNSTLYISQWWWETPESVTVLCSPDKHVVRTAPLLWKPTGALWDSAAGGFWHTFGNRKKKCFTDKWKSFAWNCVLQPDNPYLDTDECVVFCSFFILKSLVNLFCVKYICIIYWAVLSECRIFRLCLLPENLTIALHNLAHVLAIFTSFLLFSLVTLSNPRLIHS